MGSGHLVRNRSLALEACRTRHVAWSQEPEFSNSEVLMAKFARDAFCAAQICVEDLSQNCLATDQIQIISMFRSFRSARFAVVHHAVIAEKSFGLVIFKKKKLNIC